MDMPDEQHRLSRLERLRAAWARIPFQVLQRGYVETPRRLHKNWFFLFYFVPAVLTPLIVYLFINAITPIPTLEKTVIYEGTAAIWRHPSQGMGTILLKREGAKRIEFDCRFGAMPDPRCLPLYVLDNQQKYKDRPAKVWAMPKIVDIEAVKPIALQIEIDGKMVLTYEDSLKYINHGGFIYSNSAVIVEFTLLVAYAFWVLIGFPYLNYKHWQKSFSI